MVTSRAREWWAQHRPSRRQPVTLALMVALTLVLAWVFWDRAQADQRAELSEDNAREIAEQVRDACDRQGTVARLLGDTCRQAEQIAAEPAEPVVAAPTDEQLRPLVQQYVAEWLVTNPPPPGRDGRDGRDAPSLAELTDVIMREIVVELERNPPPAGEDGQSPTPEQLRPVVEQEVAAFLEANPPPSGPPGEDGEDGEDGERGPAGPTCPDGTTLQAREMTLRGEVWFVCVEDEEGS